MRAIVFNRLAVRASVATFFACVTAVGAGVARAQVGPDDGPSDGPPPGAMRVHSHGPPAGPDEDAPQPAPVSGTVDAYNRDPRGRINGLILHDGEHVIQLNTPPDWSEMLTQAAPLKDSISATAVPERVVGDRTIERLVTLSDHGKTLTANGPGERNTVRVEGSVAQLNYSPHGEVDGALLDSGDFVHTGPGAAATLKLAVGQKLTVDGRGEPIAGDHQAVEAVTVNGTHVPRPPHPMDGPGMRGRPMGGGGGPDDSGPGLGRPPMPPDGGPGADAGPRGAGDNGPPDPSADSMALPPS